MDFIGSKMKRMLVLLGVIAILAGVIWPFLRGGRAMIHTGFVPINGAMEEVLEHAKTESVENHEAKPRSPSPTTTLPASGDKKPLTAEADQDPIAKETASSSQKSVQKVTQSSSTEATSTLSPSVDQPASHQAPSGRLDLNLATLEQLDKLPGIGESKAKAILDYRLKKGRFKRIEELRDVKGIGEKMLAKLKDLVYISPS